MTHDDLVIRGRNWFKNNAKSTERFPIILTEFGCFANSIPDVIGLNHNHTAVIECKVSRADYFADQKKCHRQYPLQLGNYRYYLCPEGLIKPEEVTGEWGLLYAHAHKITIEKPAVWVSPGLTRPQEYQVMYSLIRRLMSFDGRDKTLELLRGQLQADIDSQPKLGLTIPKGYKAINFLNEETGKEEIYLTLDSQPKPVDEKVR